MDAYIYRAALYCDACGARIRSSLDLKGSRPETPENECSFDSDDYPKGPYPNGGGEADTPQHCDSCGLFLENPLTKEGGEYIVSQCLEFEDPRSMLDESWEDIAQKAESNDHPVLAQWIRFYYAPGQ